MEQLSGKENKQNKISVKRKDGTSDSLYYDFVMGVVSIWRGHCQDLHVDNSRLKGLEPPFIVLCNHESFYDFYYTNRLLEDYRPTYVINHHITTRPILRYFASKTGMIPKKLFTVDNAVFKIARTLKAGYPVVLFPEGRLSLDGTGNPLIGNPAVLIKRFKIDLVIARVRGSYFAGPKWRKSFYRSRIDIAVEQVIRKEEICDLSVPELKKVIADAMTYDESEGQSNVYPQKNRAEGLENVLYRCADCGALYTTRTKDADLYCTSCGSRHHLDEYYHFTDDIGSIHKYYDTICDMERKDLDSIDLKADVKVKIFSKDGTSTRREEGVCTLDKESFRYSSSTTGTDFTIPVKKLDALAFSCDEEFELYYDDELYYFYPVENRRQVVRWALAIDLFREERNEEE